MNEPTERHLSIQWPRYALKVKTRGVLSWGDFIAIAGAVWLGNSLSGLGQVLIAGWLMTR
jgi:hypothetical protein